MHDDCPFCEIVAGERSAHVIYEDEDAIAFLDENPAARGHTLVVPRTHREEIVADPEANATALFDAVSTVSSAIEDALDPDGFSVFHTTGSLVGTITHAHVHVVPRVEGDGIGLSLVRDELDEEAGALADALAARC
ncbi:HIT family protein [Halovivax gelatinilyticus]|uniref:HIT family protein n=1 Tax=Halovivax gelatinilyticus TaxID=2961597 RepID=UPI0020CA714E|nr:HIT family protein [Halovivax gelatinilyticus]